MEQSKDVPEGAAGHVTVMEGPDPSIPQIRTETHSVPLTLLTVFAVIFILDWAQTVFIPLVLGVVVSYALSPLVTQLHKWHVPRTVGAAALLLLIVGGIGSMAFSLHDETVSMIETLPEAAQKLRQTLRTQRSGPTGAIENVQKAVDEIEHAASETAAKPAVVPRGVTRVQIEEPKFNLRDYLWSGTIGALSFISLAVMVLVLTFFLMASGDTFRRKLVKLSGPTLSKKRITVQMLNEITSQIQRYLLVQVFTSTLVGIATWLAFLWVGMEHAAVWGVAAGVLNLIPYLGAIIITGGTTLVAFMQFGTMGMALTVGTISLVINSIEGYLLTPWLSGRASRMNAVVVFAGILFWGWLWGAWGLLLGMPIMMAIKSVCDRVEAFTPVGEFMGD
ncbi:MAG TPA: AI-2E family transporter [Thiobacillus sp.]|nr:MAG: AI-2E family transporter [Hydrogenophilales bacterium 16-64-40]OZA35082.1 MAG: AI-2E family transporter [Hydrogenophilales bacterium 17-64-65]HQS80992.1 AI-2E family transporter [Thiobacillus sp.]HQT34471.1 AI-2E family transporter [Thiobacillus sp.]